MTEKTALARLGRGQEEALAWVIRRYTPYVCAVIRPILGQSMTEADVEETAADVFLVLWERCGRVEPGCLRPWLAAVARNKAKQKLRSRGLTLSLEEDILELPGPGPEEQLQKEERDRAVREAVLSMGQPDREIFLRHYYHCQTVVCIGREMGIPVSTVKSRLRRGREKLRASLEELL